MCDSHEVVPALAQLYTQHKIFDAHIARVHGGFVDRTVPGRPEYAIVMEWCSGGSLAVKLHGEWRATMKERVELLVQVGSC